MSCVLGVLGHLGDRILTIRVDAEERHALAIHTPWPARPSADRRVCSAGIRRPETPRRPASRPSTRTSACGLPRKSCSEKSSTFLPTDDGVVFLGPGTARQGGAQGHDQQQLAKMSHGSLSESRVKGTERDDVPLGSHDIVALARGAILYRTGSICIAEATRPGPLAGGRNPAACRGLDGTSGKDWARASMPDAAWPGAPAGRPLVQKRRIGINTVRGEAAVEVASSRSDGEKPEPSLSAGF